MVRHETQDALLTFIILCSWGMIVPLQCVLILGIIWSRKRLKLERQRLIHQVRISQGRQGRRS